MEHLNVLIVENNCALAQLWERHLRRGGAEVRLAHTQDNALDMLEAEKADLIIMNVVLRGGSAFSLADNVRLLHPHIPIIYVTNSTFFSDGSIFGLCPNACAYLQTTTPPEDLAAMVEHYGRA
ncbi:MAG: response regulator [Pseudomonadota bacterium]